MSTDVHDLVTRADRAQVDPETLLALHTPDTVVVNITGRRVLGRDALADAMTAALASPLRDVRTSVEILDVRAVTADVTLVSCVKTVHDTRTDADRPPLPARGVLTYVLVRDGAAWRIALAQTTPIVTPP